MQILLGRRVPGTVRLAAATLVLLILGTGLARAAEVNVYSYRQPFLIKPMLDVFTRQTGIDVNVVFADKGLAERLQREGQNSPADLVFTVDIGRLADIVDNNLTATVADPILNEHVPAEFRDPHGQWFGLTLRARVLAVSRDRVKKGSITRYEDLAKPEFRGRVCTRSGKHTYMVALIASMIAHHGEEKAEQWLAGVKQNLARKPTGNDRAQVKAVKEGICDVAVINHYYMALMLANEEEQKWAEAVDLVFPNQPDPGADRGTHVNISGMSLTRSAPNRDSALLLMRFLTSDLAQQMYADQNNEYPIRADVPRSGIVRSFGDFKADELPMVEIAKHRVTAARMVDKVGYDL